MREINVVVKVILEPIKMRLSVILKTRLYVDIVYNFVIQIFKITVSSKKYLCYRCNKLKFRCYPKYS